MAKPNKRISNQGTKVETKKNRAKAFANWAIVNADGTEIRCDRGFPIFQNPDYPSKKEDLLVGLAEKMGGTFELNMKVTIRLNTEPEALDIDAALESIFGSNTVAA